MNVSYNWLTEYVPTDLSPEEVAAVLTRIGLNVDGSEVLVEGDVCFDVEVTSNRPDCLGHLGVAREFAAAVGADVAWPSAEVETTEPGAGDVTDVDIVDTDLCPLYTARIIRGVRVGASPAWLRTRLESIGVRPVSNIVDITNYVMMECGQPLHAFDFAKLSGGRIIVRPAEAGEMFTAIDHSEHALSPERLVIADAKRPVALAGVMGGVDTEIAADTTDVLLEAAVFAPLSIRATARALAMFSPSSYRFERRVDPHRTDWASRRACRLMAEVAGGEVAEGVVAVGKPLPETRDLTLRLEKIPTVLGLEVPAKEAARILESLELEILKRTAEEIRVRVPTWRGDLKREIDLVEEVARHWGYDKIPESSHVRVTYAPPTHRERVTERVGEVLTAAGYHEAITFSFTSEEKATRLAAAPEAAEGVKLRGVPLVLRQSVLPGLLDSLRANDNAGITDARLYEVAHRYLPTEGSALPTEDRMLALASRDDFAAVKGVIETLLARLGLAGRVTFEPAGKPRDLDPGASAALMLDDRPLGRAGRVTVEAAKAFGLDEPPMVAELLLESLTEAATLTPTYEPLPQFPAVERDLALIVDDETRWEAVAKAVQAAGVEELERIDPMDVYRGEQVPDGKKSIAVRLAFRSHTGTLTGDEVDAMQRKLLEVLKDTIDAELRA